MDPAQVQAIITGYQTALVNDAVNPQPSYNKDGQSVSREEWRESMQKLIIEWQKVYNNLTPFINVIVQRL